MTVARRFGLRYLLHVHDYNYTDEYRRRGALMKSLIASLFRHAEKILVLGHREHRALSSLLQLPQHQVAVLHNAVPDPLRDGARPRRGAGTCHILFLGHLSVRKGVPELLQALSRPALSSRQWRATLAGGGPVDEFRRLATDLGIAQRVDFPGWLGAARIRELCGDADVLVLPSHAEGLAMAVLEGISYGLAVIATPVGAHPEVIEPEVSGILVPPGDVEALADALVRLVDDEGLRRRFGRRGAPLLSRKIRRSRLCRAPGPALRRPARGSPGRRNSRQRPGLSMSGLAVDGDRLKGAPGRLPGRVDMLGVGVMPLDLAQAVATLDGWREEGRRDYVCCVSVHGLVTAQRDREVRSALNRAGLATTDGMPLVWWCRRAGFARAGRVCGSDLLEAMCALAVRRGHRHYFYGGSPDVVERLVSRLTERHPGLIIAGHPVAAVPPADGGRGRGRCRRDQQDAPRLCLGRARHAQAGTVDGGACRPDRRRGADRRRRRV